MPDILIRSAGGAGHITLNRPEALNALTYDMVTAIDSALKNWAKDPAIHSVVIDATGDRAFCAGGDIADLYARGRAGDFDYGPRFWRDEYQMNARLADFDKPVVSFLQGFTMGGGVGVGCHAQHRIVGESSQIAMPEVGIGLVPDVGGSLLLARAPGRLGDYLGLTAARMASGDAIYAGFADHFLPEANWEALKEAIFAAPDGTAVTAAVEAAAQTPPAPALDLDAIASAVTGADLNEMLAALRKDDSAFAADMLKRLGRNAPLSMACTIDMLARLRQGADLHQALELEYRFTSRASEHADFLEGIRAAIIDKDRSPNWKHSLDSVPAESVSFMLSPLGDKSWDMEGEPS